MQRNLGFHPACNWYGDLLAFGVRRSENELLCEIARRGLWVEADIDAVADLLTASAHFRRRCREMRISGSEAVTILQLSPPA